jgi:hypothetical protein
MSTFIKFGNHLIAPANAKPIPFPKSPEPTPRTCSGLLPSLQSNIKDLERMVAQARQQEMLIAADRNDRNLVVPRAQDSKGGENLTTPINCDNFRPVPVFPVVEHPLGYTHGVRPTTPAAFNRNNKCYHTLTGSAWQITPDARTPSESFSLMHSPPIQDHDKEKRNCFL